jgi:hypothetical protein
MSTIKKVKTLPEGYIPLEGSERHPAKEAKWLGASDEKEIITVSFVLRRRPDGPPLPDFDFYKTSPGKRRRITSEEFADKYGAHPDEIARVTRFAESAGLKILKTHHGRRTIKVSGTVAQINQAFAVDLGHYERPATRTHRRRQLNVKETYRGREGFIHLPKDIAPFIVGVFGLDNRRLAHRTSVIGDPPIANPLTMQQITTAYNFPSPGPNIAEQTIGVVSASYGYGGYLQSDLDLYFGPIGLSPQVIPISIEGCNNGAAEYATAAPAVIGQTTLTFASIPNLLINSIGDFTVGGNYCAFQITATPTSTTVPIEVYDFTTGTFVTTGLPFAVPSGTPAYFNLDGETNQDICISAAASGGANVAVYFFFGDSAGWIDVINRVIEPEAGDFPAGMTPPCALTFSYSMAQGDDPNGLANTGLSTSNINAMTAAFQDAALFTITVCCAAGDTGTNNFIGRIAASDNPPITYTGDGFAHVIYPATDPWVLAAGGTTLGQYLPSGSTTPQWVEYVWNDPFQSPSYPWGTGGGGVSDFFPLPSYQSAAGVPNSINTNPALTPVAGATVPPPIPFFSATGRGIPDVAANASVNTGFAGIYLGGQLSNPGNGTSASSPFWAGLIALLNSNLGYNIGFANPIFYEWGPSLFNPINPLWPDPSYPQLVLPLPAGCPADNGNNGIPGYPAGPGWDACTGLGSPNATALLGAFQALGKAYVLGGYQSPDIIITNITNSITGAAGTIVPLGGTPGTTAWDTLLVPNLPYGFQVTIHNSSSVEDAYIDSVSFWAIPGGVGTSGGTLLATINPEIAIPPGGSITVPSSYSTVQFTNPGSHMCAVVSIYSDTSGCSFNGAPDPVTNANPPSQNIPDPGASGSHACSAWRNTDTMSVPGGSSYKIQLGFGEIPGKLRAPVMIQINTAHIPFDWNKDPKIRQVQTILDSVGAKSNAPLYLLPQFIRQYRKTYLENKITVTKGGHMEEREGRWYITPEERAKATSFEITGKVPESAKKGDILLLNVTAHYPATTHTEARSVGFLEFIYIT